LHLLMSLGYRCIAAHCNFMLRGEESMRDERMVIKLCKDWNVKLELVTFDTKSEAEKNKISIEMAARDLRYHWFEEIRKKYQVDSIAIAHHRDDSVETLLLNLIRGAGVRGLAGIKMRNNKVVRPLLCLSKEEIVAYTEENKLPSVHDSSNDETLFLRNKVRHELIPYLETINPSVRKTLGYTIEYLQGANELITSYISKYRPYIDDGAIPFTVIEQFLDKQYVLFELLHPLGFNSEQVMSIVRSLESQVGKQFDSITGWRVIRERDQLIIVAPDNDESNEPPHFLIEMKRMDDPLSAIKFAKEVAIIDSENVTFPLNLRKWQHGDRFSPFGMAGTKLISDYMTDRKMTTLDKENQWVVYDAQGNIIWLVNQTVDNRYRLTEKTRIKLVIRPILSKKSIENDDFGYKFL
ncbi:MAG: tRNA lysidine(34) synthetase TilS, partial [Bacteroidaceae bacterium]